MVTAVVIIILSLAMFVYWFRYSCLLIAGPAAQLALREMALVVGYMAGECEEKLASVTQ